MIPFRSKNREPLPFGRDCVGPRRGSFNRLSSVKTIYFWDAEKEARAMWSDTVQRDIRALLKDTLPESSAEIGLVLYMVGYTEERAKPTIIFVSCDKLVRKQAFNLVKESGILQEYPGFQVANIPEIAEFESFGRMAGCEDAEPAIPAGSSGPFSCTPTVFTNKHGNPSSRRLLVYKGLNKTAKIATAGGVVSCGGRYMFHTVNHLLDESRAKIPGSCPQAGQDDDGDFEITGLSDDNEQDEEEGEDFIYATSRGSMTPESATSDVDLSESILSSGDTAVPLDPFTVNQSRLEDLANDEICSIPEPQRPVNEIVVAGEVVFSSAPYDSLFIEMDVDGGFDPHFENAIPLEDFSTQVEPGPRDAAVKTATPTGGTVRGTLSGTPSFFRLPGCKEFQEVYLARLNRPLVMGDCGSWVRDAVTGKLFGHVIAGSPKTGLVMIMPAHGVFRHALEALSSGSLPYSADSPAHESIGGTAVRGNEVNRTPPPIPHSQLNDQRADKDTEEGFLKCQSDEPVRSDSREALDPKKVREAERDGRGPTGNSGAGKKRSRNGSPDKERTKKKKRGTPIVKRPLACPFYKYDAIQHQKCATYRARSAADVRQHLQRSVHPQQPLHCPVCKIIFTGINNPDLQRQLNAHRRAHSCRPNNTAIPGITLDQAERIRATQQRRQPIEETWFNIWDILFPNANRPDSPYLETDLGGMIRTLTAIYLESSSRDKLPLDAVPHMDIILNHFVSFVSNMPVTNFGTQPQHDQATTTTATSTRTTTTTATARTAPMGTTVQPITTGSTGMIEYTDNGRWHLIPSPFAEQNPQHTDQNQALNPASNQFQHHQYPVLETTQHLTPGSTSDVLEPHYAETEQDRSYFFDDFTPPFGDIGSMLDRPAYFPPTNFQNEDRSHGNT